MAIRRGGIGSELGRGMLSVTTALGFGGRREREGNIEERVLKERERVGLVMSFGKKKKEEEGWERRRWWEWDWEIIWRRRRRGWFWWLLLSLPFQLTFGPLWRFWSLQCTLLDIFYIFFLNIFNSKYLHTWISTWLFFFFNWITLYVEAYIVSFLVF